MEKFRRFGREGDAQLSYCTRELLTAAQQLAADLYIAHSEPGLWVAAQLARMGRRIGVDMEDWFSEDLLPEARRDRRPGGEERPRALGARVGPSPTELLAAVESVTQLFRETVALTEGLYQPRFTLPM